MLDSLVLVTNNRNKAEEIEKILNIKVIPLYDIIGDFKVEETGSTYLENAYIKASFGYKKVKKPVIAEDSGLEVYSLKGEPGIYSARYGNLKENVERIELLLKNMEGVKDRRAKFVNFTVLIWDNGTGAFFEGTCEGEISLEPRGEYGFGYDPVFIPEGYDKTFAELGEDVKNRISHRARALTKLKNFLLYYKEFGE